MSTKGYNGRQQAFLDLEPNCRSSLRVSGEQGFCSPFIYLLLRLESGMTSREESTSLAKKMNWLHCRPRRSLPPPVTHPLPNIQASLDTGDQPI